MTKWCIVPQLSTPEMRQSGISAYEDVSGDRLPDGEGFDETIVSEMHCAMIAARPPLPDDIQWSVEFARTLLREGRGGDAGRLARALLKCNGIEP